MIYFECKPNFVQNVPSFANGGVKTITGIKDFFCEFTAIFNGSVLNAFIAESVKIAGQVG